jgi:hypothetical protein
MKLSASLTSFEAGCGYALVARIFAEEHGREAASAGGWIAVDAPLHATTAILPAIVETVHVGSPAGL